MDGKYGGGGWNFRKFRKQDVNLPSTGDCVHSIYIVLIAIYIAFGLPGGSVVKSPPACRAGDTASVPGSERSLGKGNGNSLQNSWLANPMDRGAWWATVHGVTKSQT